MLSFLGLWLIAGVPIGIGAIAYGCIVAAYQERRSPKPWGWIIVGLVALSPAITATGIVRTLTAASRNDTSAPPAQPPAPSAATPTVAPQPGGLADLLAPVVGARRATTSADAAAIFRAGLCGVEAERSFTGLRGVVIGREEDVVTVGLPLDVFLQTTANGWWTAHKHRSLQTGQRLTFDGHLFLGSNGCVVTPDPNGHSQIGMSFIIDNFSVE